MFELTRGELLVVTSLTFTEFEEMAGASATTPFGVWFDPGVI